MDPGVSFDPDPGVGLGQDSCVWSDQDPVVWLGQKFGCLVDRDLRVFGWIRIWV